MIFLSSRKLCCPSIRGLASKLSLARFRPFSVSKMASEEDDDLELLLSMQDDENVVVTETPPSSASTGPKISALRTGEKDGFYGKVTESASATVAENFSFSRRMAEIRSSSVAKANKAPPRHSVVTTHSKSSTLQSSGSADALDLPRDFQCLRVSHSVYAVSRTWETIVRNAVGSACENPCAGYCSDEETPRANLVVSMDAFKEVVKETLEAENKKHSSGQPKQASQQGPAVSSIDVEYFSGLKIKDRLLPPAEVYQKLEDLRFVRLPAIKMANECGKFAGSWATVAILVEKGQPRQSSTGKDFVVWKLGTLDSTVVSIFLFGDAYKVHWKEQPGSILACFNANVRADPKTKEPSLSVYHCDQIIMLGTSVNFAVCKGTRKNGTKCTVAINKRLHGEYCQYHMGAQQQKYKTNRPELNGGKLAIVGPGYERGYLKRKPLDSPEKENTLSRPLKIVTTSELRSMLSDEKLTTRSYSQGKRFLETMAGRAVGNKRPTCIGVKQTLGQSIKTNKRVPLAETLKNVNNSKAEHTTSASLKKPKYMRVLDAEHVPLAPKGKTKLFAVERVTSEGPSRVESKAVDKEIEIEWSEDSEGEMAHALPRFQRVHGSVSQALLNIPRTSQTIGT